MPAYVKHTGGIAFDQVKCLMRLRNGAHHLRMETGRWLNPRLPRYQKVCQKCTWGTPVEDELHVLFECPTYHHIRLKYEHTLFAGQFGGVSQVAKSIETTRQNECLLESRSQTGRCLCVGVFRLQAVLRHQILILMLPGRHCRRWVWMIIVLIHFRLI
jgi:hypothetical protein